MINKLRKLYQVASKYWGTRNVFFPAKNMRSPKMGQRFQGTVKNIKRTKSPHDPLTIPRASQVMGGGKYFNPIGAGPKKRGFLPKSAKIGPTRGTKAAAGATPVIAGGVGLYASRPTGPATAGQKQFSAVRSKPGGLRNPAWKGDVASYSKSGYHKFKSGSKTAKAFSAAFKAAAKAGKKQFTWGVTGKKYAVSYK